jgi:hypothetical protein
MLENLRPSVPGSRGHPPDLSLGPRYTRTQAAPAQPLILGSVTRQQPTLAGYPSGPHWRPRCRHGPRSAPPPRTATPSRKTSRLVLSAPSPRPKWQSIVGLPARCPPPITPLAPPKAARRPSPVGRLVGPSWKVVPCLGRIPSCQTTRGVSATPLASETQRETHPQHPPGRLQRASA